MTTEQKVSITLHGKPYVISTDEQEVYVQEAAALLNQTMEQLSEAGIRRDDQLALFSALKALVDTIKERDEHKVALTKHVNRLTAAFEAAE